MLRITRHNVTDRNADRERNFPSGLGSDLLTGMLHLRNFRHQMMAAFTREMQILRGGIGIKRPAYCPVAATSVRPHTRHWQTSAAVAGHRSAG